MRFTKTKHLNKKKGSMHLFQNKIIVSVFFTLSIIFRTDLKAQDHTLNGVSSSGDNSKIINYDLPENLKPGEEFIVTINMMNNGNNKWTKNNDYKLSLFDQSDNMYQADVWGIKEVSLPYDVNPDEKVMFIFKITAPQETGTYNCRWVMTKSDQFFGEYTANMVNVTVDPSSILTDNEGNNSEFIQIDIPEFMNSGEKYKVIITMKNTGANSWYSNSAGDFTISPVTDSFSAKFPDWNNTSYYLSGTIDTGQESTIEFFVTAPPESGIYSLQWGMKKGDTFFGQKTKRAYVNVSGNRLSRVDESKYNSVFISQDIPKSVYVNEESSVSVTYKNTGSRTWIKGYDKLVFIDSSKNLVTLNKWYIGYIQLQENIEPGNSVTFNFKIKPREIGWHDFRMIMMTEDGGIFGEPTKATEIIVSDK